MFVSLSTQHVAGYVGLSKVYNYENFFLPINEMTRMLTPDEVKRIKAIGMDGGESAYREILTWALDEVSTAASKEMISGFVSSKYREFIFKEQDSIGKLFDDDDQSISFAYYHFICFLSAVYLPLFAMSAALDAGVGEAAYWLTDVVSGCIVLLQAIFVVGLRVLAENMSDPFGSDVGNLSVMHYVYSAWRNSARILLAKKQPPVQMNTEEKMSVEHISLGNPFDKDDNRSRRRDAFFSSDGFEIEPPMLKRSNSSTSDSSHENQMPQPWSVDEKSLCMTLD